MTNYKTEQEKQDKEFKEEFPNKIAEVIDDFGSTVKSDIKSYLLSRDSALLEAFKKDVGEMIVGLKREFWDDQDHAVGGYISRKEINDFLKDYNLNK